MTETIPEIKPAPEGVGIEIPAVWMDSLIGGEINSLVDPHVDQPVITIQEDEIDTLIGMIGQDKINFTVKGNNLDKLGYLINVGIALAWDPDRRPNLPLLYQSNLNDGKLTSRDFRLPYLPKYPYLRAPGTHKLVIAAQMREVTNKWNYANGTYTQFSDFPRVGSLAVREITVVIVAAAKSAPLADQPGRVQ